MFIKQLEAFEGKSPQSFLNVNPAFVYRIF